MRIQNIIKTLPFLALLCACQSEAPQVDNATKCVLTVKASLPGSDNTRSWITYGVPEDNTRAQITYGNPDPNQEIFMWDEAGYGGLTNSDYISLFNITRFSNNPIEGVQLAIKSKNGRNAIFQSVLEDNSDFKIKSGDQIFVNYWHTLIVENDDRNIFKIGLDSAPQLVVNNPDNESLSYMQSNLKMYDVLTVEEDDVVPDIHFKHLSAIMRVTLRNETDSAFWLKELKFDYSGTKSFFNKSLYCSTDSESEDGSGLKIYPNLDGSETYTDSIKSDINNYTAAATEKGTFLKKGQSYDLYLSCVPRIANTATGNNLIITLQHRVNSKISKAYSMNLEGFKIPIEAGKRYWFNLTAVDSLVKNDIIVDGVTIEKADTIRKLVFTNEWLANHPEKNPENGEESTSGDE